MFGDYTTTPVMEETGIDRALPRRVVATLMIRDVFPSRNVQENRRNVTQDLTDERIRVDSLRWPP